MPNSQDDQKLKLSRQKYAELEQSVAELKKRGSALRDLLRQRRFGTALRTVLHRSKANLREAIRYQGGLRNTFLQALGQLRQVGPVEMAATIFRRLKEPGALDTAFVRSSPLPSTENSDIFQFKSLKDYHALYQNHLETRAKHRNIAVFRAVTGGYDRLLPYGHFLNEADYTTFTDEPARVFGVNRPVPYFDISAIRRARYVKLHPHLLFPEHDIAVWHDGNVMINGDIRPLIDSVISSGLAIGTFLHPKRDSVYDEAEACVIWNKDDADTILRQVERYSEEGFLPDQLAESNFIVYNLRHPDLDRILTKWWFELDRGSLRDQLSFNYAVEAAQAAFLPLAERPTCVRDHPAFTFFPNHGGSDRIFATKPASSAAVPAFGQSVDVATQTSKPKADVLVCVHNALDDVKACLRSVVENRPACVDKLVIVDDGSGEETRQWLETFVANHAGVVLHHNEQANGYTKAANKAVSLSNADNIVLLNSDAIVGADAIRKMLACLYNLEGCGIVGPLSNAASYQSIPRHLSSAGQTAINSLPDGFSPDDMDAWCARNAFGLTSPGVPFVHGFCMCVKRAVFDRIGSFDEAAFPNGYGEENDFCIRASNNGFRLNVAIEAFVFHAKSKSYTDNERRTRLMNAGNEKLRELHGQARVDRLVQSMQHNPTLAEMRSRAHKLYI
ncbi:putative glycosyltransferase (plasmid) [Hoeflea sp. IMCC20628]|uniref:glycosyltransferase n=1 Tax=Hoeflea sp. IMCC20628 TaxID=1620421 RepID=UPI00063BE936|nr:glycosyltransferase [Hoeflea sp. IMCC20628]AKI03376.1 putative glycosyltransferase [Hoeflea sp. IMCC20628]